MTEASKVKFALPCLLAGAVVVTIPVPIHAQFPDPGLYIIFDGSGSMWGKLDDDSYKINAAKSVLQDFVSRDFAGHELALRAYGHRREADCTDTELVVPFSAPATAAQRIRAFLAGINPLGRTPITRSLREALADFGDRSGEIILISDGIETCNDDPCALMAEWREKDVAVRVHVVGFGVEEKEKEALQCISNAAGTEYRDAGSAQALAEGLASIYEGTVTSGFFLIGTDASGNRVHVDGVLSGSGKSIDVTSERRNQVEAGEYELLVGIRTRNGSLYRPVTLQTSVAEAGETTVRVEVPLPPRVYAAFSDEKGAQRGSLVSVLQDSTEIFRFRWIDTVYIDPGTYEFRAAPNAEYELSVTETVQAGEQKAILFRMVRTVRAIFRMEASESGIWFRENYELWQDDELKYKVHVSNGAQVPPGIYDLKLPSVLTPFVERGIEVTDESTQQFTVTVPAGHVTFVYLKPDGTRDSDDRVFVSRVGSPQRVYRNSGVKHALTPGSYTVAGWTRKGDYDLVTFEVAAGEDKEVVLHGK